MLGGTWLHLRTWWHASALDRELADGADPFSHDDLSLRAGQLNSTEKRAWLACAMEGVVELATGPPAPWGNKMPLARRSEVRACQGILRELAALLRRTEPLPTQGLAMTSLLIGDGGSPLYSRGASTSLTTAALSALAVLEPRRTD
jgi:hypothetical protein